MSSTTTALTESRRRTAQPARQRVINAVNRLAAAGDDLSVSSVARAARVHRSLSTGIATCMPLSTHHQAARDTTPSDGTRASRQALQADLANALERNTRQTQRISRLEKLSQLLGDNAWRESGLGAPPDIDSLQQRITSLEQQLSDVAAQLAAREDDLGAARNASREFRHSSIIAKTDPAVHN